MGKQCVGRCLKPPNGPLVPNLRRSRTLWKVLFANGFRTVAVDTLLGSLYIQRQPILLMSLMKIQVGQLWKKDGTGDIYLVTRLYSEALNTMAVLRKSGAEGEAQIRVRVERGSKGQTMQGFSPAQEEESY